MGGSVTGPAGLPLATGAIWWQTHEIWSNATRIQNHPTAAWNVKLYDTLPFQDNFTKFSSEIAPESQKQGKKNMNSPFTTLIHDFYKAKIF